MKWLQKIYTALFAVLCIAQLLVFAPHYLFGSDWLSDLSEEFALHYLLCFTLSIAVFAVCRRHLLLIAALAGTFVNVLTLLPLYYPHPASCTHCGQELKIVQFNLYFKNAKTADFVKWAVADSAIDVLILSEANTNKAMLEPLKSAFPYFTGPEKDYSSGLAIFSRIPLSNIEWMEILHQAKDNKDLLSATLSGKKIRTPLRIFAAHAPYSLTPEDDKMRRHFLATASSIIHQSYSDPVIFVGDLNASPWHSVLRSVTLLSGLHNAQLGLGFFDTWNAITAWRNWLDGLMIDQMFISDHVHVESREPGPDFGSDHLPVITRLQLEEQP